MELLVVAVVVIAVGALIYYNRSSKNGLDVNQDGKIDVSDVKAAVENAAQGLAQDASKVKTAARKTVAKKSTGKKTVAKPVAKPRGRKSTGQ